MGPGVTAGGYTWVDCPAEFKSGPVRVRFKEGTTKLWYQLQPENHRKLVTGKPFHASTFKNIDFL